MSRDEKINLSFMQAADIYWTSTNRHKARHQSSKEKLFKVCKAEFALEVFIMQEGWQTHVCITTICTEKCLTRDVTRFPVNSEEEGLDLIYVLVGASENTSLSKDVWLEGSFTNSMTCLAPMTTLVRGWKFKQFLNTPVSQPIDSCTSYFPEFYTRSVSYSVFFFFCSETLCLITIAISCLTINSALML